MKKIRLMPLGLLLPFVMFAQHKLLAQQTWTTQISPNNSSEVPVEKLIKTQDGGFIAVLHGVDTIVNMPQNIIYYKLAIVKLDNNGDTVFYKKISVKDSSSYYINDFIELPTGELMLNGSITTVTSNDTTQGTLLIKTTNTGDTLWSKINYNQLGTGFSSYSLVGFSNKFWRIEGILPSSSFDTINYFVYEYDYNGNLLSINYQDTMVLNSGFDLKPRLYSDINDTVLLHANWKNEGISIKKLDATLNKFAVSFQYSTRIVNVSTDGSMAFMGNDLWKASSQFDSIWQHPDIEYKINWGAGTSQYNTNICSTSDGGYAMIGDTWNALVNNIT